MQNINFKKTWSKMEDIESYGTAKKNKEIKNYLVRIKLTDGSKINGQVNINREYSFSQLSDLILDKRQSFLILLDAVIYMGNLKRPVKQKVVFVNKKYIIWATPDND